MKLSVIVPAYNEESIIGRNLEAILAAHRPDGGMEVIVVNNASTDRTADIARSYSSVQVVTELEKGLTKARQCGNTSASGEILYYIDADTLVPPHLFKYVMSKFESKHDLVACSGPYKYHDWTWYGRLTLWLYHWILVPITQLVVNRLLNRGTVLYGGNFALRKDVLDRIGGFDTNLEFWSEDTQIGRRMAREGNVRFFHRAYVFTSARRFYSEGFVRVLMRYILNFFWDIIFHRPFTKGYNDVRSPETQ